jgi:hypothetical protein
MWRPGCSLILPPGQILERFESGTCNGRLLTARFEVQFLDEELKQESGVLCKCAVFLFCVIISIVRPLPLFPARNFPK